MEALAGLSLAANIIQVVDFAHDTVTLFTKIYQKQAVDPGLNDRVAKLEMLGKSLESSLSQSAAILNRSQKSSLKSQLPSLCAEVVATAKELRSRLNQPLMSKRKAFASTLKIKFGGELSKISALDDKLRQLEQNLQTGLLSDIWTREEAVLIQRKQDFGNLEQNVRDIFEGYAQGQMNLQDVIRTDHAAQIAKLSDNLQAILSLRFDRTAQHVTQVVQSAEKVRSSRRQKEQLLSSVLFATRNARKSAIKKAHEETFGWIFAAPDDDAGSSFRKWIVADESPIFWISGKPGSGKSTLMKFLVSSQSIVDLLNLKHPKSVVYSHFIWMADKQVDGTLRGMLCSLIYQILEVDTNDYLVQSLIQNHPEFLRRQSPDDWDMDELQLVLQELISLHQDFVVMFIDGLDELGPGEDKFSLRDFVKAVLSQTPNLKVCVSSRPEPEEKLLFRGLPSIELQRLTRHDLEKVAQDHLSKYFDFALRETSEQDRRKLVNIIINRAEGVFLWITLALTRLRKGAIACDTAEQLKESLEETPIELNDLYQKMWDRLGSEQKHYQKDAAFVFSCLLKWEQLSGFDPEHVMAYHLAICREDLSARLFSALLSRKNDFYQSREFLNACVENQRQVEFHCAGLVEFVANEFYLDTGDFRGSLDQNDPRILRASFIHRSVRDFLLGQGQTLLEQPNEEVVYTAIFRALTIEAVLQREVTRSQFSAQLITLDSFWDYSDPMSPELGGTSRFSVGQEAYQEYFTWIWQPKRHLSLTKLLIHCQRWKQYTQSVRSREDGYTRVRGPLHPRSVRLLETAFETHGISDVLEQLAIHLDHVNPDVNGPLAVQPLSTYLTLQRLDQNGIRSHSYGSSKCENYMKELNLVDMGWAYPHTILAVGHTIPQLMTLPERVVVRDWYLDKEELLICLRHLRRSPSKWILGSVFLDKDLGGCLGTECGVVLTGCRTSLSKECYEVVFRATAATFVNRFISRALVSSCPYHNSSWSLSQLSELKALTLATTEEMMEILLVGRINQSSDTVPDPTIVFDPMRFKHLFADDPYPQITQRYENMLMIERLQYFSPTELQSATMSGYLDPDLLMERLMGPYEVCICGDCQDPRSPESTDALHRLKQRRKERVNAIKSIIDDVLLDGGKPIYDILNYLRSQGHYIPTEDDLLEFLEADSTLERVTVLERLNREKAKEEAWMTRSKD